MSEEQPPAKYFDLDEVLEKEVKFGKFQVLIFFFIAFPIFLNGISSSSYIFTAGTLNYRCRVPECEKVGSDSGFLPDWLNISIEIDKSSNQPAKCERFLPISRENETDVCTSDSFDRSAIVKCDEFIYEDKEVTILNEFDLNCDQEVLLSVIGTINNIGQLLCYVATGFLSDKYGRKIVLIVGCLGSGLFGILRAFSFNYAQFAALEFLDSLFGAATYSTSFIIGLEMVTPNLRTIFGTLLNCFYALGEICLGLIAMWIQHYKYILLISYIPALLTIFYVCILPESIRWLISRKKNIEAIKILLKASKLNGTKLSERSVFLLEAKADLKRSDEEIAESSGNGQRSKRRTVIVLCNISYLWFATIFVYYGLNINAVYLEYWNKYISYIVVCLIELPSYFLTNILMEKLGRKKTMFLGMIGSGIFCILSEFIAGSMQKTIFFIIGKMLITISFSCLYIFTIEVFPTNLRHRFFSICSVVGRIGSILTPLTPILAQNVASSLPLIIFSALSLSSAILLCTLPETKDRKMPDTVKEAFN